MNKVLLLLLLLIIAELSGRHRQSPIVLGGEDQSLGTKDTLSIGPLDTQGSHVFINPVRYTCTSTCMLLAIAYSSSPFFSLSYCPFEFMLQNVHY